MFWQRNLTFVIRNIKEVLGILPVKKAKNKDIIKNTNGGTKRLTYEELEALYTGGYNGPTVGSQSPDLIVTTKGVTAGIRSVLEGKQLVQSERDPYWGVIGGTKFQQALIVADEYAPGLRVTEPRLQSFWRTL
jgi:hypothetical protein